MQPPGALRNQETETTTEKRRAFVLQQAAGIFGRMQALTWMAQESRALGGLSPSTSVETDAGYEAVLALFNRVEGQCATL